MKVTPEILKKYANQECSEEEKNIIDQWLKEENHTEVEEEIQVSVFLEEKIWKNINDATGFEAKRNKKTSKKKVILTIAASIAILLSITLFKQIVAIPEKTITYQTLVGEMKSITLTDGTVINLNANSILKIPERFTTNNRIVSLQGEAYFEVAKDSLHPFVVQTQKSETTVLGTKFNLSAYKNEDNVLTLDEGKVSFKDKNGLLKPTIVFPNQQVILNNEGITKNNVNTKYYKGWINNTLYFNNESFLAISHKIERIYGVEIQIENKQLNDQIYKGAFENPSIETLLDDLSFVLKFKYEIKGNKITIH